MVLIEALLAAGVGAIIFISYELGRRRLKLRRELKPFLLEPKGVSVPLGTRPLASWDLNRLSIRPLEREELSYCLDRLRGGHDALLVGRPASGKSVLLSTVGSRLRRRSRHVYFIDLKAGIQMSEGLVTKIRKGYLLLDDAHLDIAYTEGVLRAKRIACLVAANEIPRSEFLRQPTFKALLDAAIKLDATDIAYELAREWLPNLNEAEFESAWKGLRGFDDDLWMLLAAIDTYQKEQIVSLTTLNGRIRDRLSSELPRHYPLPGQNDWQDLLVPLSVFGAFEIRIGSAFLSEVFGMSFETLSFAASTGQLILHEGEVVLAHRSLAQMYLIGYQLDELLGNGAKRAIREYASHNGLVVGDLDSRTDWILLLLNVYLHLNPSEILYVLRQLGTWRPFVFPRLRKMARIISVGLVRQFAGAVEQQLLQSDFEELVKLTQFLLRTDPEMFESIAVDSDYNLPGRLADASDDLSFDFMDQAIGIKDASLRQVLQDKIRDALVQRPELGTKAEYTAIVLEIALEHDPEFAESLISEIDHERLARCWTSIDDLFDIFDIVEVLGWLGGSHLQEFANSSPITEVTEVIAQSNDVRTMVLILGTLTSEKLRLKFSANGMELVETLRQRIGELGD